MRCKPGTKVLITEDCRPGGKATGQVGVYEGDFPRSVIVMMADGTKEFRYDSFINGSVKFTVRLDELDGKEAVRYIAYWCVGEVAKHPLGDGFPIKHCEEPTMPYWFPVDNPRIKLPDGSVIWGDECWWGTAGDAPPLNEAQEQLRVYKAVMGAMMKAAAELKCTT